MLVCLLGLWLKPPDAFESQDFGAYKSDVSPVSTVRIKRTDFLLSPYSRAQTSDKSSIGTKTGKEDTVN